MNIAVMIILALTICTVVAVAAGMAIATPDDWEIERDTREELLAVLKREKWKLISLSGDPIEQVTIIYPPYDWADEGEQS